MNLLSWLLVEEPRFLLNGLNMFDIHPLLEQLNGIQKRAQTLRRLL